MSGIYGRFQRGQADSDPSVVVCMATAMAPWAVHRRDQKSLGPSTFGHCAVHITPESHGEAQPRVHPQRPDLLITADAWLDNRDELFAALGVPEPERRRIGDAELILRTYERWGEACAPRLLGDFAFAIWDDSQGRLFCARDFIGVRPFVYFLDDEHMLFASDLNAVLAGLPAEPPLCEEMVASFLVQSTPYVEKRRTFF